MGEKLSGAWGGGAGIEWLFNVMYYIWLRMLKVCLVWRIPSLATLLHRSHST